MNILEKLGIRIHRTPLRWTSLWRPIRKVQHQWENIKRKTKRTWEKVKFSWQNFRWVTSMRLRRIKRIFSIRKNPPADYVMDEFRDMRNGRALTRISLGISEQEKEDHIRWRVRRYRDKYCHVNQVDAVPQTTIDLFEDYVRRTIERDDF